MSFFVIILTAFTTSLLLTLVVRTLAIRYHFVDTPDLHHKVHRQATPLGGGVAVFIGCLITVVLCVSVPNSLQGPLRDIGWELIGLMLGAGLLCAVGIADDTGRLRGRQKLLGQLGAVAIVMAFGLVIQAIRVLDWQLELGLLAVPFTIFWLLGAINAMNLIDGIDGLAACVGLIISIALGVMAMLTGHIAEATIALTVAGSLLGFLFFNLPPASIFLGDTGSMVIGLVVGVLAIRSVLEAPATMALAAPVALWAIPIIDCSGAILRRKLTGRSIYEADRGHFHHCLLRRGCSGSQALTRIATLCTFTGFGALASVYLHNEWLAALSVFMVIALLVFTRMFGHFELNLLAARLLSLRRPLVRPEAKATPNISLDRIRRRGSRQWNNSVRRRITAR